MDYIVAKIPRHIVQKPILLCDRSNLRSNRPGLVMKTTKPSMWPVCQHEKLQEHAAKWWSRLESAMIVDVDSQVVVVASHRLVLPRASKRCRGSDRTVDGALPSSFSSYCPFPTGSPSSIALPANLTSPFKAFCVCHFFQKQTHRDKSYFRRGRVRT